MRETLENKIEPFFLNLYEEEKSKKTIQSYRQEIYFFINWVEGKKLTKVTMIDFKEYLQKVFAPTTCNHYIIVINKFLKYCGFNDLKLKKIVIQEKTSLNDQIEAQEHQRMLRWAKKKNWLDMYYIMQLFAYSGPRVKELNFFIVESFDWHVQVKNKGKYRELIIPQWLVREIRKFCRENNIRTGYIFRSPRNTKKPISPSTVWDRLKRIAKAAKINPNKIHPHAWRHLFAKAALNAGMDLGELKDTLGHSRLDTTTIYTKTSSKDKRKKLEEITYSKSPKEKNWQNKWNKLKRWIIESQPEDYKDVLLKMQEIELD